MICTISIIACFETDIGEGAFTNKQDSYGISIKGEAH